MAGEEDSVAAATSPAPAAPDASPKVRSFACPSCGGPLTVRGLQQTESIACGSCGAVIDLGDENLRVISTFASKIKYEPLIPLGARGKLKGETFEAIGYMRRAVNVEGVDYEWSEYLLFNPYKGFRWLSEYNGHWTDIRALTDQPEERGGSVSYLDRQFQHFQSATARVTYVLGEFYWRVEGGESVSVADYVSPPFVLSREGSKSEVTWSLGEYVEPKVIAEAFQPKTPLPPRIGVAPSQPSPYAAASSGIGKRFGQLIVAAILLQLVVLVFSQNRLVYRNDFTFRPSDKEKSLVTDVFELAGRISNVAVKSHADVSNNWVYLSMALIDEATGNAYDFGREISYYSGHDSEGAWSEGSTTDEAVLPSVPPGRYYLRIEPEGPSEARYSIEVYRDVPRWLFFFLALGALAAAPVFILWRRYAFESKRWSESDHPMWSPSFDSDDDD